MPQRAFQTEQKENIEDHTQEVKMKKIKYCKCKKFRQSALYEKKTLADNKFCQFCGEKFKKRNRKVVVKILFESYDHNGWNDGQITLNELRKRTV